MGLTTFGMATKIQFELSKDFDLTIEKNLIQIMFVFRLD